MELLLLWKSSENENWELQNSVVALFRIKDGYAVADYLYQPMKEDDYFDYDIDCDFSYYHDLDSAIAKYEECTVANASNYYNNAKPAVVSDDERKFIFENKTALGTNKSCVLASYEYADEDVICFLLYLDSGIILYDAHQITEQNGVDYSFKSGISVFDSIEEAVDEANDILSMTFDLDFDCYDKDEIMARAKELKVI